MQESYLPALGLLAAAGATDWLDGFLARRWNQVEGYQAKSSMLNHKGLAQQCLCVLHAQAGSSRELGSAPASDRTPPVKGAAYCACGPVLISALIKVQAVFGQVASLATTMRPIRHDHHLLTLLMRGVR